MPRASAAAMLAFPLAMLAGLLAVQEPGVAAEPAARWLADSSLPEEQESAAQALLKQRPLDLPALDRVVRLYAQADPATADLLEAIDQGAAPAAPSEIGAPLPSALASDVSLRLAAEHFIHRRYGEALAWLASVDPGNCVSPELAYYYRAVSHHQLGQVTEAGETAKQLLQIDRPLCRRTQQLARMMKRQADAHEEGSLTHIALLMEDVERRFDLQRTAPGDQQVQQQVIDALDKLIKQAEEQQQQQQQQ
ncbi:MAG: hypothetical protein KDA37_09750, partial [Planctomycetales bacterium]|nr:hypothetical protein [Planctomycetales bacterium]